MVLASSRRVADYGGADTNTGVENEHPVADLHHVDFSRSRRTGDKSDRIINLLGNTEFACDQIPRPRRDNTEWDRGFRLYRR